MAVQGMLACLTPVSMLYSDYEEMRLDGESP